MTLYHGDAATVLATLPAQSVRCCVTSPPYYGLRDYGTPGQIGLEETPDAYVARLVDVFRAVRRVLTDDGTVFLNLGDSYYHTTPSGPQGKKGERASRAFTAAGAGGQRGGAYGTSDITPASYRGGGCLCGSLCDACRKAYRTGKSHSGSLPAPMPTASPSATNPAYTESASAHLPTSDSVGQGYRTADATRHPERVLGHAGEPPRASQESTPIESSPLLLAGSRQSDPVSECLLCGRSFVRCVQESDRRLTSPASRPPYSPENQGQQTCTHDTASTGDASDYHREGMACDYCSYVDYTTPQRHSLKPKDLLGIPWLVAFALRADGWYLRSDIVWHKPNAMPESVRDRPTKAHEYLFLLTKGARYYYDADAVTEPATEPPARFNWEQRKARGEAIRRGDPGQTGPQRTSGGVGGNGQTRNRRSVWAIPTRPYSGAHFATMPPALVEPCVLAGSAAGDTVIDPFAGSGTTGAVAVGHGRAFIGIDLNADYLALARTRIAAVQPPLMGQEAAD